jgi:hypothetical protein
MTTRAGCWTHQHLTYMKNLITRISNRFDQSKALEQAIIQGRVKTDEQGRIYLNTLKNL